MANPTRRMAPPPGWTVPRVTRRPTSTLRGSIPFWWTTTMTARPPPAIVHTRHRASEACRWLHSRGATTATIARPPPPRAAPKTPRGETAHSVGARMSAAFPGGPMINPTGRMAPPEGTFARVTRRPTSTLRVSTISRMNPTGRMAPPGWTVARITRRPTSSLRGSTPF